MALTILLAAIFTGLSYPVSQWLLGRLRGRALAAIATLVLLLALVMAPLLAVLEAGANEALRVTETIRPASSNSWISRARSTAGCEPSLATMDGHGCAGDLKRRRRFGKE